MSVADEKSAAAAAAVFVAPARLMVPKFLASALLLAFVLILFLDASLFSLGPRQYPLDRHLSVSTKSTSRSNAACAHGFSCTSAAAPLAESQSQTEADSPVEISPPESADQAAAATAPAAAGWISASVTTAERYTSTLLSRWLAPGGEPCRDALTSAMSIPGLDGIPDLRLAAGDVHTFVISALDELGNRRCLGGDYFETDLSGRTWKSRPPITDHGNGSYSFKLQVHPDFVGNYTLTIVLLFRNFQGLKFSPARFKFRRELRKIPVIFYSTSPNPAPLPELRVCRSPDFRLHDFWSGRWTRHGGKETCVVDNAGRYRCLAPDFQCRSPWCEGALGALESNGWVYSAHCSFMIFTSNSAWKCLKNKWLFFSGDSNHVDTIRNLLNFVLGLTDVSSVPRRFDMRFVNPRNKSESVRITSIFNGHWNDTKNYLGLESLRNDGFRQLLWRYFSEDSAPNAMILNSGLHDGVYWKNIRRFADGAEYAARFWEEILMNVTTRGVAPPRVFYRTTIATGGYARDLAFNPHKMEAFNGVLVEKLKERGLLSAGGVVDEFDMTFPWHYDNRCSDGVHYGRAPAKARWRDGEIGHQYFVDLMLAHVLLNAICNE